MKRQRGGRRSRREKPDRGGCLEALFWMAVVIGALQLFPVVADWLGWDLF